jgi:hypothetical protein
MLKRTGFLLVLVLLMAAIPVTGVMACSGYPYFGVSSLPTMELLVRATVIDTDDRGYNAVIRVEDYYKGEGPALLTVMRYQPALSSGALLRGYDTSCLYAGRGHYWHKGTQGYFGLISNGDGTYSDDNNGSAHFIPVDGFIAYEEGATEGFAVEFDDPLKMSEAEFIELLLEVGERDAPVKPTVPEVEFYPLMRFLNVTTTDGTRYQINPDRSVMRLPDDAPLAISPDGAHVAFLLDDDTISFQYIWTTFHYTDEYLERFAETDAADNPILKLQVPGQAVRFSNDSNLAVVWDAAHLAIYMFGNEGQSIEYGYGTGIDLRTVAEVKLKSLADDALHTVLWSADSSTLVWEDGAGIWRWNIINDAEPQRVMTTNDIKNAEFTSPALLDVSMYGRFVRVGAPSEWLLIDGISGKTYKNTLASPTEQFLLHRDNETPLEKHCTPPLRETCAISTTNGRVTSMFTYQLNLPGLVACDGANGCAVSIRSGHPAVYTRDFIDTHFAQMRQMLYDPQYQQFVSIFGEYQIHFDLYPDYVLEEEAYRPYLDIVDLEDEVDSPIASIEWGQSVFYDEYMLTTNEYIPR